MKELTERQKEVLDIIKEFKNEHCYSPSVREICEMLHLKSPRTVSVHLKKLKDKGYITYVPNTNRTIRIIED